MDGEWRCQLVIEAPQPVPDKFGEVVGFLGTVEEAFESALLRPCSGSGAKPGGRKVDIGWAYFTEAEARAVQRLALAVCDERGWRASSDVRLTGTVVT